MYRPWKPGLIIRGNNRWLLLPSSNDRRNSGDSISGWLSLNWRAYARGNDIRNGGAGGLKINFFFSGFIRVPKNFIERTINSRWLARRLLQSEKQRLRLNSYDVKIVRSAMTLSLTLPANIVSLVAENCCRSSIAWAAFGKSDNRWTAMFLARRWMSRKLPLLSEDCGPICDEELEPPTFAAPADRRAQLSAFTAVYRISEAAIEKWSLNGHGQGAASFRESETVRK